MKWLPYGFWVSVTLTVGSGVFGLLSHPPMVLAFLDGAALAISSAAIVYHVRWNRRHRARMAALTAFQREIDAQMQRYFHERRN